MSLAELRQELAQVIPPSAQPDGVATGWASLDHALGGTLPRGLITEITGPAGSGRTTLLRRLAEGAIRQELLVAYIDAERTLNPRDWAHLARRADDDGLWVIRPPDPARAAWCSELLLRSGAFPIVILDGGPVLPHAITVRLASIAREHDASLIVSRTNDGGLPRGVTVAVRGRTPRTVEVEREVVVARRLCAHPEIPDRRGVERRRHAPSRYGRVG
jgi:recombination protein RecA